MKEPKPQRANEMSRARRRQWMRLCAFGLLFFAIYHLYSPWRLVIEIRSATGPGDKGLSTEQNESLETSSHGDVKEGKIKKDSIKKSYGELEDAFLKSVDEPSSPPKRSRDDSIKLIYNAKSPEDWMDLIESHDSHGLTALTKIAQRYIYTKQNPSSCSNQKFLILNKFPGDDSFGLGAIVQRISDYLSVAIQTNSVLVYATDASPGEHFIQPPTEPGGDPTCGRSFDCIFQPLSKCKTSAQKGIPSATQSILTPNQAGDSNQDLDVEAYLRKHGSPIPPVFEDALRAVQPDITAEMLKYWWRGQAASYIMRLNGGAAARMKEFRLGKGGVKQFGIQWDVDGHPKEVDMPFPMPEGTSSMHVRHGDKGSEMRLVPFNDFVVRAESFGAENPLGSWKRAFLSTEDPNVIEQMKSMARISPFTTSGSNARWTWYWSDIPRLNTSPETQLRHFGNRTDLTIMWILQLVMAIECDTYVGTRGSGWNRLIDSLRCTWLASCKQPFLEVGFENDWQGYGP